MFEVSKAFSQSTVRSPNQKTVVLAENTAQVKSVAELFVSLQEL
jgi:hypothetical protein